MSKKTKKSSRYTSKSKIPSIDYINSINSMEDIINVIDIIDNKTKKKIVDVPFIEEALTILSIKLDQIPLTSSSGKSSQIRSKRKMLLNKIEEISKRIEFRENVIDLSDDVVDLSLKAKSKSRKRSSSEDLYEKFKQDLTNMESIEQINARKSSASIDSSSDIDNIYEELLNLRNDLMSFKEKFPKNPETISERLDEVVKAINENRSNERQRVVRDKQYKEHIEKNMKNISIMDTYVRELHQNAKDTSKDIKNENKMLLKKIETVDKQFKNFIEVASVNRNQDLELLTSNLKDTKSENKRLLKKVEALEKQFKDLIKVTLVNKDDSEIRKFDILNKKIDNILSNNEKQQIKQNSYIHNETTKLNKQIIKLTKDLSDLSDNFE